MRVQPQRSRGRWVHPSVRDEDAVPFSSSTQDLQRLARRPVPRPRDRSAPARLHHSRRSPLSRPGMDRRRLVPRAQAHRLRQPTWFAPVITITATNVAAIIIAVANAPAITDCSQTRTPSTRTPEQPQTSRRTGEEDTTGSVLVGSEGRQTMPEKSIRAIRSGSETMFIARTRPLTTVNDAIADTSSPANDSTPKPPFTRTSWLRAFAAR